MKPFALSAFILMHTLFATAQVNIHVYDLNDVTQAKPVDTIRFVVQYQTTFVSDTVTGEDGRPYRPKNTPYNPIERE